MNSYKQYIFLRIYWANLFELGLEFLQHIILNMSPILDLTPGTNCLQKSNHTSEHLSIKSKVPLWDFLNVIKEFY